jgi:ribosomal protein S18 acetylase RimI-like enzyme
VAVVELQADADALLRTSAEEITELTRRSTGATYFAEGLQADEIAFIERVVRIAGDSVTAAARNPHQHVVTAMSGDRLAGFVIATAHAEDSRELDWLMVDPDFHGSPIASDLMRSGMAWLGKDRPMWLNVVRHNERAIRFYRKHGFEIDPEAVCAHVMPHWIMRRP